ncbi:MAG: Crp/Fnr family transcriptional regulator, partial [Prevotella sp.]|nr:Crp/Fnr family transcriptional regulator [Prevotella sp.]
MIVKEDFDKEKIAESMTVLWEPLTPDQRKYLVDHIKVHLFEKNETIYKQNEQPTYLMCLLKGKIKVYMNGVGGRTQIIRVIEQMGIFSYRAAFVNENYKTSASAFEASTVCMIPINVIRSIIEENNELAVFFIRQLCKMLGEADALTVNLTQKHMRGRLAESLIILRSCFEFLQKVFLGFVCPFSCVPWAIFCHFRFCASSDSPPSSSSRKQNCPKDSSQIIAR